MIKKVMVKLKCDYCGGTVEKSESQAKYSLRHYCNNKCKKKGYKREY